MSGILCMDINWIEIIEMLKSLVIIVGGVIGLYTYRNQQKQRRIDNSFKTLEHFAKNINQEDIETWEEIVRRSYESCGAELGYFVTYDKNEKIELVSFSTLFATEGKRLYVPDFTQGNSAFYIDAIRRMAEQFNLIGYQYISKNIDFNIIYFELGQLMDNIYNWIDKIDDLEHKNFVTKQWFPYFIKMYKNTAKERENLPQKTYIRGC